MQQSLNKIQGQTIATGLDLELDPVKEVQTKNTR